MEPDWPNALLFPGAATELAAELACRVRLACRIGQRARLSIGKVLKAGGFSLRQADLGAAAGGREALLLPTPPNGFDVVVDPTPRGGYASPDEQRHARSVRQRFRTAHEIGHSFFYDRRGGLPARSTIPGSAAEEEFCDRFAQELLLPTAVLRRLVGTAEDVFDTADTAGVSVEVAARAFASAHPRSQAVGLVYWRSSDLSCREPLLQWASDHTLGDRAIVIARQCFAGAYEQPAGLSFCLRRDKRQMVLATH